MGSTLRLDSYSNCSIGTLSKSSTPNCSALSMLCRLIVCALMIFGRKVISNAVVLYNSKVLKYPRNDTPSPHLRLTDHPCLTSLNFNEDHD